VHGLVGENGAGKSTLVKIMSGIVRPDAGTLELDGTPVRFADARDAAGRGIAVVSQELTTFGDLTVLENLFLDTGPRRLGVVDDGARIRLAAPVLAELGLRARPHARVGGLPLADQQLLEICRALLQHPRVLILDEPTSALPREAVARLRETTRRLAGRGLAVLYISHFLEDVMLVADRVTVLRDGRVVLPAALTSEVRLNSLVEAMLGAAAAAPATRPPVRLGKPSGPGLVFNGVTVPGRLDGVSFDVTAGEIVGLAGLRGAGHTAVLDAVCGRCRPTAGTVRLPGGRPPRSRQRAVRAGVASVSGDRKALGLMLDKPLWENVTSVRWLALGRGGRLMRRRMLRARAADQVRRLGIRGRLDAPAGTLSGGNQQKAVFAKWLDAEPAVVVLDDPTRGVDIGARAEMHELVRGLAADGRVVLVASTDLVELADLCHRVLVFQHGHVVDQLAGPRLSEHELSLAMNAGFATDPDHRDHGHIDL
jgi:ribose transport system ATP-binding protein